MRDGVLQAQNPAVALDNEISAKSRRDRMKSTPKKIDLDFDRIAFASLEHDDAEGAEDVQAKAPPEYGQDAESLEDKLEEPLLEIVEIVPVTVLEPPPHDLHISLVAPFASPMRMFHPNLVVERHGRLYQRKGTCTIRSS